MAKSCKLAVVTNKWGTWDVLKVSGKRVTNAINGFKHAPTKKDMRYARRHLCGGR